MEGLLSMAFENIATDSRDKTRKGLRQIEGLLAQICLSTPVATVAARGKDLFEPREPQSLQGVACDPAFRAFFRLQNTFEYNISTHLLACLERLLGSQSNEIINQLITLVCTLLQGIILLHPPSRVVFGCNLHMNLLLDLLDADFPMDVQTSAALLLTAAMINAPQNIRVFEASDGIRTATSLCKHPLTSNQTKDVLRQLLSFNFTNQSRTSEVNLRVAPSETGRDGLQLLSSSHALVTDTVLSL